MKKLAVSLVSVALITTSVNAAPVKGGIGAVFGGLIGLAVGKAVGKAAVDTKTVEDVLVKMANTVNKRMPMTVDQDTRADNITPGPGRRFTYNYTITSATLKDIDPSSFIQAMGPHLKSNACSSPDMRVFFEHGVTVGYLYRSSDGAYVAKMDVSPKDCGYLTPPSS